METILELGVASFPVLVVLCLALTEAVKHTPLNNKWLPCISIGLGILLGLASWKVVVGFPAEDPITAAAIGAVSGLTAVGFHQTYKQISKAKVE